MDSKLASGSNILSIDRERLCFLSEFGQPLANWLASLPGRCAIAALFCVMGLISAWAAYRPIQLRVYSLVALPLDRSAASAAP